ncbi:MAG: beta-ketoacyl-ACP synthase II [Opitutales bacterium]|nr:beta-ketoacyl-ACP synthase II [Opitutales bacterium]
MAQERIFVTGMGVISALGEDIPTFWSNITAGKSSIGSVTAFDTEGFTSKVAGEIHDFDVTQYMDPKEAKRNDRYTHFALAAAKRAVEDSGVDFENTDTDRVGVLVGSGIGGMDTIEKQAKNLFDKGPRRVSAFMIPSLISNIASGIISIEYGLKGPNFGVVSACATGSHAIGEAARIMRTGDADIMLAGGSEATITALAFAGFCSLKAMSTEYNDTPELASRPFDLNRDGFVMGEGAGVLVLETESSAKKRGAKVYAEVAGYSATNDAYHITAPTPDGYGLSLAIRNCLRQAEVTADQVGYINAHGTSTKYNDSTETGCIKSVFGDAAYKVPVSSTKSMTGHLLGAAGAVEAICCIQAINEGVLPPTINYTTPDPECDLDYVPNTAREAKIDYALSNNLGFGGHNTSILFKRA